MRSYAIQETEWGAGLSDIGIQKKHGLANPVTELQAWSVRAVLLLIQNNGTLCSLQLPNNPQPVNRTIQGVPERLKKKSRGRENKPPMKKSVYKFIHCTFQ